MSSDSEKWMPFKALERAAHWTVINENQETLFTCWRGEDDARRICELHNAEGDIDSMSAVQIIKHAQEESTDVLSTDPFYLLALAHAEELDRLRSSGVRQDIVKGKL